MLPQKFPTVGFYFQPADMMNQILNFGLPAPIDVKVVGGDYKLARTLPERIAAVKAEAYSFGQPNVDGGPTLGQPNTFIFAFADIGGTALYAPTAQPDTRTRPGLGLITESRLPRGTRPAGVGVVVVVGVVLDEDVYRLTTSPG